MDVSTLVTIFGTVISGLLTAGIIGAIVTLNRLSNRLVKVETKLDGVETTVDTLTTNVWRAVDKNREDITEVKRGCPLTNEARS